MSRPTTAYIKLAQLYDWLRADYGFTEEQVKKLIRCGTIEQRHFGAKKPAEEPANGKKKKTGRGPYAFYAPLQVERALAPDVASPR